MTGIASADSSDSATGRVVVQVVPIVSISILTEIVNAGTVQTGDFSATLTFRVDSNVSRCLFQVKASDLYKAYVPTNPTVAPIPLNQEAGIIVQPSQASPIGFASNVLPFDGPDGSIELFPVLKTIFREYESSQSNGFTQEVDVTVTWSQDDLAKPLGMYGGVINLQVITSP